MQHSSSSFVFVSVLLILARSSTMFIAFSNDAAQCTYSVSLFNAISGSGSSVCVNLIWQWPATHCGYHELHTHTLSYLNMYHRLGYFAGKNILLVPFLSQWSFDEKWYRWNKSDYFSKNIYISLVQFLSLVVVIAIFFYSDNFSI